MSDIKDKIHDLAVKRKEIMTQDQVSKMTGVSRSNVANFERGRINNMYLYDFYLTVFGGDKVGR